MNHQPPDADGNDPPVPPGAGPNGRPHADEVPPADGVPLAGRAVAAPRVLGYRSVRDETPPRRKRRPRRHRRMSKAGLTGFAAASQLAVVAGTAFAASLAHHHAGRGVGPAGTVCIAFPLSYVAVMCGVVGCLPRGQDPLFGRCALVVTGVSWVLYGVAFVLAAR